MAAPLVSVRRTVGGNIHIEVSVDVIGRLAAAVTSAAVIVSHVNLRTAIGAVNYMSAAAVWRYWNRPPIDGDSSVAGGVIRSRTGADRAL